MYSWIDNTVLGLKDVYKTNDVYDLYNELNIDIKRIDANNILLKGNEAFYNRDILENEVVFIRNDLEPQYEKFILAHELGHALLHTHVYTAAFNKDLINTGKLEKQANYFAFKLLNLNLDQIAFEGFSIEQLASNLYLPISCFKNITDKI